MKISNQPPSPSMASPSTTPLASTSPEIALKTRGLRKLFGDFLAVDGIDLDVPQGSFYGFLGPNGAGKSTTIKCLTGLLEPSDGSIEVLGFDGTDERLAIQRLIGVVPEDLALFDQLTALETLEFIGRIHGLELDEIKRRSTELLEMLKLEDVDDAVATEFSHGMRKKLALAAALLPAPRLLFLDEPFEGIDAVASRVIRRLLEGYTARGGTIFLTSHILAVVESLCDHVGIIHQGKLVAQGSLEELREGRDGQTLEDLFLGMIGAEEEDTPEMEWLR